MSNSITVIHGDLSPEKMGQRLVWDADYRAGGTGWGDTVHVPSLPKAAAAVVRRYRAAKELVNDGDRYGYNQNWMAEKRQMLKDWAKGEINNLRDALKKEADGYLARFAPPAFEIDEARSQRVWNRLQSQLDAGVDIGGLVSAANMEELGVLNEEVGGYYRAKNPNDLRVAKFLTDGAIERIDQRRAELDPEAGRKMAQHRDAVQGVKNVEAAFNWADGAIEDDDRQYILAYGRGEAITI